MAYDFPASPTNGQQYTPAGGQTYTWDAAGTKWTVTGTGLSGLPTASIVDVITGTSTSVAVTPDALAGLWEKGSNITAASTITIPNTGGGLFDIVGTANISSVVWATPKDGRWVWLIFQNALTLINGATLALPGGQNILVAPFDRALFIQAYTGQTYLMHLQRTGTFPSMHGTYTPGTSPITNVTSVNPYFCGYYRVGDMVTVAGKLDVDPVAIDTAASFAVSAPVTPIGGTFAGGGQAAGVFTCLSAKGQNGGIYAEPGTANFHCEFIPASAVNASFWFFITYQM